MSSSVIAPPRNLTLTELTDQVATWRDTLEGMADDGPDAAYIRAKLDQLESLHTNKVDRVCAFLKWLEAEQSALKADKQRFERRQRQYADLENRRRDLVRDLMSDNAISQMKGRAFTLSLCPGKQRLEIDATKLPKEYFRVIPEQIVPEQHVPDEDAIRAALDRNEEVVGARFVDGQPYVQIR